MEFCFIHILIFSVLVQCNKIQGDVGNQHGWPLTKKTKTSMSFSASEYIHFRLRRRTFCFLYMTKPDMSLLPQLTFHARRTRCIGEESAAFLGPVLATHKDWLLKWYRRQQSPNWTYNPTVIGGKCVFL